MHLLLQGPATPVTAASAKISIAAAAVQQKLSGWLARAAKSARCVHGAVDVPLGLKKTTTLNPGELDQHFAAVETSGWMSLPLLLSSCHTENPVPVFACLIALSFS